MSDLRLSRGAKTAMALALQSPDSVADIVAVDNAPVDAVLGSDFTSYIRAMKKVDQSRVTKMAEADKILQEVEKVRLLHHFLRREFDAYSIACSPSQFVNSFSEIFIAYLVKIPRHSKSLSIHSVLPWATSAIFPSRIQLKFVSKSQPYSCAERRANTCLMKCSLWWDSSFPDFIWLTLTLATGLFQNSQRSSDGVNAPCPK